MYACLHFQQNEPRLTVQQVNSERCRNVYCQSVIISYSYPPDSSVLQLLHDKTLQWAQGIKKGQASPIRVEDKVPTTIYRLFYHIFNLYPTDLNANNVISI